MQMIIDALIPYPSWQSLSSNFSDCRVEIYGNWRVGIYSNWRVGIYSIWRVAIKAQHQLQGGIYSTAAIGVEWT
jgi:hypothetical protein